MKKSPNLVKNSPNVVGNTIKNNSYTGKPQPKTNTYKRNKIGTQDSRWKTRCNMDIRNYLSPVSKSVLMREKAGITPSSNGRVFKKYS